MTGDKLQHGSWEILNFQRFLGFAFIIKKILASKKLF